MKRTSIIVVLILLIVATIDAQINVHTGHVFAIAWDAPTTTVDGFPIPDNDGLSYEVYITQLTDVNAPVELPQEIAAHVLIGEPTTVNWDITCTTGFLAFGVRAVLNVPNQAENEYSTITWSNAEIEPDVMECVIQPGAPSDLTITVTIVISQ